MKKLTTFLATALVAGGLSAGAQAHRAWVLPMSTVLSSEDPWVTFDAAISNDIFYADYHPLRTRDLQATGPDGESVELHNASTGKYRSTFDLNLKTPGTYKVFLAQAGLTARWEDENGERRFWPGRGEAPDPARFASEVPMDATNLLITRSSRRIETFVTAGEPDSAALAPTNVGFELVPVTHPNDLYAGESASFRFLMDGEPAVGAEVSILPAGMRYRNAQEEITLTTDADGLVAVGWPGAGRYFLEASYADDRAQPPASGRRGSYAATFEVLPL
ncbi:MAG: ABC transporter permease [Halioglobus sp.]|nr:ABC transporter permease [Halioglobus sp.]|tara:strand:+ start:2419 stop:3246 length:828 start_codon:yes stop_codon:yes gene_type:complete